MDVSAFEPLYKNVRTRIFEFLRHQNKRIEIDPILEDSLEELKQVIVIGIGIMTDANYTKLMEARALVTRSEELVEMLLKGVYGTSFFTESARRTVNQAYKHANTKAFEFRKV